MRIVLVVAARIQQPGPRRQHRRHINHGLAARDQLLRQQRADTGRAFHRPHARCERCRPTQQPFALATIGNHRHLANELLVAVDHRRGMRTLCGSIPMMNTNVLLASKLERRGGHS